MDYVGPQQQFNIQAKSSSFQVFRSPQSKSEQKREQQLKADMMKVDYGYKLGKLKTLELNAQEEANLSQNSVVSNQKQVKPSLRRISKASLEKKESKLPLNPEENN